MHKQSGPRKKAAIQVVVSVMYYVLQVCEKHEGEMFRVPHMKQRRLHSFGWSKPIGFKC